MADPNAAIRVAAAPAARVRPYEGRCRSGWVHSRYVEVVAG